MSNCNQNYQTDEIVILKMDGRTDGHWRYLEYQIEMVVYSIQRLQNQPRSN